MELLEKIDIVKLSGRGAEGDRVNLSYRFTVIL